MEEMGPLETLDRSAEGTGHDPGEISDSSR